MADAYQTPTGADAGDYSRDDKVLSLVKRCIDDASHNQARLGRDRQDWLNLLFERGGKDNQWVIWDERSSRYVPRGYNPEDGGLPAFVPRPTTNVYALKIDGIAGLLNQSEPALQFAPGSDDDNDRATAEVCEDALPVLREECGYDRGDRERLNRLVVMTNAAAYTVYFDPSDRHGTDEIELFRCNACGTGGLSPMDVDDAGMTCPECGAPDAMLGLDVDMWGAPKKKPIAKGKICGDIAPSFEFSVPSSARHLDVPRLPWVLMHTRMAPEDVETRWPKAKSLARDRSQWAGKSAVQRQYADQMRKLASPIAATSVSGGDDKFDGPVVYRLFHDAIETGDYQFPGGLYAVVINDQVVEAVPLPVTDDEGRPVKNVVIRQFTTSPVSAFGKPPADDLVPIQETRNLTEALIELSLMHEAAPTTFMPETVTLIDELSGAPGSVTRYRSLDGQKPTRVAGTGPSESLYKHLEILDQKADEVSKLNAVLAGARPDGDPTLGEVQILQERGMQAFREPIQSLIRFETDLARLLLWVGKESLWSPRMRRIRGENDQWEISQFAGADLAGHVDIQCEIASAWPKSQLMQQLKLRDAMQAGLLNPAQDPEVAGKILADMGLARLKPSMNVDLKHIARDLDKWKAAQSPADITPPNPTFWNLALHYQAKQQFLKTEEAEQLSAANPPLFAAMLAHVQQLEMALMQKQMQAAAAAAGPQPAPQADPMAAAIESGVLQPADAQPTPADPMAAAMDAGVLAPAPPDAAPPAGVSIDQLMQARLLEPVVPEPPVTGGQP